LLHVFYLRKWQILGTWALLAFPAGALLSIFNLPKTYTSNTVMRFPAVVGAQTNVMRDIAITQGESIVSIFNSFQVLEATIHKLNLRMRLAGPNHVFFSDAFSSLKYDEKLGIGRYYVRIGKGKEVTVVFRPRLIKEELSLYTGVPKQPGNKVTLPGLEMELNDSLLQKGEGVVLELTFNSMEESAVGLRDALSARPLGTSNYQISLKDRDPRMVAEILNTLREEFLAVYYGTTEVQDVGILVQMEKDLELSKERLEKSQDELSRYYASHPELISRPESGGDEISYLESRQDLERVSSLMRSVAAAYRAKPPVESSEQLHFWALELLGNMAEAGEPQANILRASLQQMHQRQVGLRQSLGPEHPRIADLEKEKEGIYSQVEEAYTALSRRLEKDQVNLRQRMVQNAPARRVSIPVKVQLELDRLNTVNQNNQNIYDRLLEAYNRAKLTTGSEFFKVTVVDPARPALYLPPSLRTRLVTALAVVVVLAVVIPALFLLQVIVFQKIWTRDDVRMLMGLKSLGTLGWNDAGSAPAWKKLGAPIKLWEKILMVGRLGKKKIPPNRKANEASPGPSPLVGTPHPLLLFYGSGYRIEDLEAYRHIREETESFFRTGSEGKFCLLITSVQPNEGKTTTSCNLAMTFARKGKRTLLIDADFRLGLVGRIFNLPVSTGVDELLAQQDMSDQQFTESASLCFLSTMQRDLVIAPRSRFNPSAGEMVSSDRFKAFIRLAKEQFDVVLVDSPPIMITPEPLSLAEVVDGVLFVCLSGGTVASDAREAAEILAERGSKVGVVLNGVRDTPFAKNRYKKYSQYYQAQPNPNEPQAEA
jgi:capsular exopolysaccharide synthesis family protein